ncbi:helix-turn-helix domain-containing protein [Dactylosporangium sp. McL0621]|uniref:helix-turn-helix domain-containing protein n=1 Tax=Dactylosporangium sp. McL0621 TaxID=3415678 RepID=UPI003CE97D35
MLEHADASITLRQWLDVVRRARLGRTPKAVALMLATYADNDGRRVFPGVARLAVDCELTYNVIQTALQRLRQAGLIEVVRKASRPGHADEYRLSLAVDVLDRIDVLTPAQLASTAAELAARRRGRHRPPASAGPDDHATPLPPAAPGAGHDRDRDLHPGACGADGAALGAPAPHGVASAAPPAPHGDRHLHPTASPPTTHGPNHTLDHPSHHGVRPDLAVGTAGPAGPPAADTAADRCAHGLRGDSGIHCPACRRGLGTAAPADETPSGQAAAAARAAKIRSVTPR